MKIHKKILVFLLVAAIATGASSFFAEKVFSGSDDDLTGWAWGVAYVDSDGDGIQDAGESDNGGAGWISLNSTDCDPDDDGLFEPLVDIQYDNCPTSGTAHDYGVDIDVSSNLVGYGWSDNYGWIRFGGLSGFPSGTGTYAGNARVNGNGTPSTSDDFVEGWARVCSVFATGCSGALADSLTSGGWDGWISLGGQATDGSNYGLEADTGQGFAWGSNVLGWMQWDLSLDDVVVDMCLNIPGEQSSIPFGTHDDGSGNCICDDITANNPPTCTGTPPPPLPLTPGTYTLVPRITSTTCGLSSIVVIGGVSPYTYLLDGVSIGNAGPGGITYNMPIGTHVLTVTDASSTPATVNFDTSAQGSPRCIYNPNYGEF